MSKEPGQMAYEAHETQYANQPDRPWLIVGDAERAEWAAVESAIRADEAAKSQAEIARLRKALLAAYAALDNGAKREDVKDDIHAALATHNQTS